MSVVFIALQCFECSTMQVKQQKKSSNKWSCVVCGQRQSIRKVFARGFQAKDVRTFVQGFNMARQVTDETLISTPEEQLVVDEYQNQNSSYQQSKKICDWSEYLDLEDKEQKLESEQGDDFEPEIVTELPREMFKKPRLKNYSIGSNKPEEKKLYSPTFAKRKASNKPSNSQVKNYSQVKTYSAGFKNTGEKKLYSPSFAKRNTDDKPSGAQEHKGAVKIGTTMGQGPSKWADYLAQDDDYLSFGTDGDFSDAQGAWDNGMSETSFNDERVEEEVHPDFH